MNEVCETNDLPLLSSERKEMLEKIKYANQRYEDAFSAALRKVTGIINTHEGLTTELKESILYRIWNE